MKATHTAKLEQMAAEQRIALTQALETQRLAMMNERNGEVEALKRGWADDRASNQARMGQVEASLEKAREKDNESVRLIKALQATENTLLRVIAEQAEKFEAITAEKEASLEAARLAHRELARAVDQQLSDQGEAFEGRLRSLASAAEGVTTALSDIDTLLKEIRAAATAPNTPNKPKTLD